MDFKTYCESKKIDPSKFQSNDTERFNELEYFFNQTGPISFTQQKLFLINDIRRRFKLEKPVEVDIKPDSETPANKTASAPKPMGFKPKIK